MKHVLSLLNCALISIVLQNHYTPPSGVTISNPKEQPAWVDFTWYNDPNYMDPTGTTGTVGAEITRLREGFPGFTFSNMPGIGLLPFEYGYYSSSITTTIYSNLY